MVAPLEKWSPTRPCRRSEWNRAAVEGDNARRLLSAVLEGVQAERDDRRGVRMAEDAEHAAFLMQPVFVEIDARSLLPAPGSRSAPRLAPGGAGRRRISVWEPRPAPRAPAQERSC